MKGRQILGSTLVLILLAILAVSLSQAQEPDASYDLNWWTVDGGGGTLNDGGSRYSLSGTIGQSDAGSLAGGGYTLSGGFWHGEVMLGQRLFLPLVVRNA